MSLDPSEAERISRRIERAHRILVIGHVDPDGDAIGSLLGLGWLLRARGKEVTLACQDPAPEPVAWLPGADGIVPRGSGAYDLAISLDSSDPQRLGLAWQADQDTPPLINIDHHVTNTGFGQINWVDPGSVATAQMVLTLADALGWELNSHVAVCLLAGLLTDTRGLRTQNVDPRALRAVLRLVEAGASLGEVARRTLDERPFAAVGLWAEALREVELEGGIVWVELDQALAERLVRTGDGTKDLIGFLAGVREAKVAVVFRERAMDDIDVSLRSAPGYDVAELALRMGGGGHPQAAGFTRKSNLAEVRERVLAELRRTLADRE